MPKTVQELEILIRVKLNISILPTPLVATGALPPDHLMVWEAPAIKKVEGIYPVDPWTVIKENVIILLLVVGTFWRFNEKLSVGAVSM